MIVFSKRFKFLEEKIHKNFRIISYQYEKTQLKSKRKSRGEQGKIANTTSINTMNRIAKKLISNYLFLNDIKRRGFNSSGSLIDTALNDKTGVTIVSMKNPPVNALTLELLMNFHNIMDDLKQNNMKGMILTSSIKNVFCAGLDLKELYSPDKKRLTHYFELFKEGFYKIYTSPFTVVGAINGHAPAGGCVLAISSDYRVMKDNFKIGLNESAVGIVAPSWVMNVMISTIATRRAESALVQGTLFTTKEALKINLIDEIIEDGNDLISNAEDIMAKFNNTNLDAKNKTKAIFRQKLIKEFLDFNTEDTELFVETVMTQEAQREIGTLLKSLSKK